MRTWDKVKSPISFEEEKEKKARDIFSEFKNFASGFRVLFLIQRHKEGGETNNSHLRKIVTRNHEEWYEALKELLDEQMSSELPMRIYASLNERNFTKAVRQFKHEQLDTEDWAEDQRQNFYLDLKNRFVGCLMQPSQRATSLFLFDVDKREGVDYMGEALQAIPSEHIIQQYPTKNGWHIITRPFNYTKIQLPEKCEFKKDALLLLAW